MRGRDVDEHRDVVGRAVGHLAAAMWDAGDRFVTPIEIEQQDGAVELQSEREPDRAFGRGCEQVVFAQPAEVVADREPLCEREHLGLDRSCPPEQLVHLSGARNRFPVAAADDLDQRAEVSDLAAQGETDRVIQEGDARREPCGDRVDVAQCEIGERDLQLPEQRDVGTQTMLVGQRGDLDRDLPPFGYRLGLLQREGASVERLRERGPDRRAASQRRRLPGSPCRDERHPLCA